VQIGIALTPDVLRSAWWPACRALSVAGSSCLHQGLPVMLNAVRKKELDAGFYPGQNPYVNVHPVVDALRCAS
jgi:hypothetical protein